MFLCNVVYVCLYSLYAFLCSFLSAENRGHVFRLKQYKQFLNAYKLLSDTANTFSDKLVVVYVTLKFMF